ncbi:MAG: PAS domain S-box protein, partial [Pyrinomonadaceae bacterium]
ITLDDVPCALWVSYDVSERKLAEDALRQSEERYSLATLAGRTGVWDVSLADQTIFVDPTLVTLLGYRTAEGIENASFWRDVVHPEDLPAVIAAVQANIANKTANFEFEHRARHGAGEWRWMYTRGYVLRDEAGNPQRLVGTATDITERKLAQDGLRQSEERYRTFIENTMEAVWRLELEQPIPIDLPVEQQIEQIYESARLAECNDAMAQMYGYQKASEIIGAPLSVFLARSESYTIELLRAFIRCGYRLTEVESHEMDRFGDAKFFVNNFVGIVEDGRLVRTWGTQRDVTRQKQAEGLLHGQQRILELIATGAALNDVLSELVLFVEHERPGLLGSILLLSSDGERLHLGVAPSLPERFNQAIDGMLVGPYAGSCGTAVYRREPVVISDISTDPLCQDWTEIAEEFGLRSVWSSPIFSSTGQVQGTFALYREALGAPEASEYELVSSATRLASLAIEHHLAERALRVSEQRFSKAFTASPNAMSIISGRDGIFLDVNDAFCEVSGYARNELLGRTVRELNLVPNQDDVAAVMSSLTDHIPVRNIEVMGRNLRGEMRAQLISLETVELNGEKCLLCATTDIAERQRAEAALRDSEERLRQSQKLEAIGRLAGGVAHDFNNILTGIIGYSDMTLHRMKPDEPLRRNLQEIRRAADRAAALTHQLLAYSRRQILQPTLLDLNAIVLDMDQMLRRLIGEDIVLRTNLGELSGRIKADRGQLEQVVMNLAVNARDAMPKGGSLTLTTGDIDLTEDQPHGAFKVPAGSYVLLSVLDTGTGMTGEIRAQIFEPFFTTKDVGKGTGLGLATVYGIVKQSGGNVTVDSEPGRGARFNIYLPRVVAIEVEVQMNHETEVPTGNETILLIEDDVTVRALAREILEMSGYRVLEAQSGDDALHISRSDEQIDLLLTDVVMPDYSGRELADRITAMRPALRVLYMSGYTDDAIVQHGVLEEGLYFLPKPFSPEALARKVRVVLDR